MGEKIQYRCNDIIPIVTCSIQLRRGLVVRIPGFHPGGPGSIPGAGTHFLLLQKSSIKTTAMQTELCDILLSTNCIGGRVISAEDYDA